MFTRKQKNQGKSGKDAAKAAPRPDRVVPLNGSAEGRTPKQRKARRGKHRPGQPRRGTD